MRLLSTPLAGIRGLAVLALVLAAAACDGPSTDASVSPPVEPEAVAPGGKPAASGAADRADDASRPASAAVPVLADQVWRVRESTAVQPGTTYTFLADGTLVIDSPGGTPMYGRWVHRDGGLHLTEEGVGYRTEILESSADRLRLRSHNPGEPVDITLERVPDAVLPPSAGPGGAR